MAQNRCFIVIRLRSGVNIRSDIKDTLRMLHLTRVNHATLIPSAPQYLGMLQKVKDIVTWGEASKEDILNLLRQRGEIVGGIKLTDEYIKEKGYSGLDELAQKLLSTEDTLKNVIGLKPVFRLHPPSKGYKKSLKRSFSDGGEVGYRAEKIGQLLNKMI